MTPQEVLNKFGSTYAFRKATGMSSSSLTNWLKRGYIPEKTQGLLEVLTGGELKAEGKLVSFVNTKK